MVVADDRGNLGVVLDVPEDALADTECCSI